MLSVFLTALAAASAARAQVTATGTMGVTNPTAAVMGTPVNQSSDARLLSINSIQDFCIFAPPEPGRTIGDTEQEQVAWCVQPRNNARVIPDGTLSAVHFVRTPLYYQVQGWGDFTKLNIAEGDTGGELDPHGQNGDGNPIGGNVTCNATGSDVSYEEWMNYMSYQQFCLRVCISENATVTAAQQCQHTLDEMGCLWVMPGDYTENSFTDCEAEPAFPPGIYPQSNGSTFTFEQRFTLTETKAGHQTKYTIGYTSTPSKPATTPASSMCTTYQTVSNGIPTSMLTSGAAFDISSLSLGLGVYQTHAASESGSAPSAGVNNDNAKATSGAAVVSPGFVALLISVVAVFAGAGLLV